MAQQARGSTYTWTGIMAAASGELIDAETLTLTVVDPDGDVVSGFPVSIPTILHLGTGIYAFDWPIPTGAALGTYSAEWVGADTEGTACGGADTLDVVLPSVITVPPTGTNPRPYLTPERYRAMGYGTSLAANASDLQLETHLLDATAEVDSYCNVPLLPMPHSFLGGRAVDEEHRWRFPQAPLDRGSRRVYLNHRPIKTMESLNLVVGFDAGAPLPLSSLVVNNREGWVEVTALTIANTSGLFGVSGWIVPMGGLVVPIAKATYTYGNDFPVVNDRLREVSAGIWQGSFGYWDPEYPVIVKSAGETIDPLTYTIDYESGRVTFTGAVPPQPLTADYHHPLNREIERATALIAAQFIEDDILRTKGMGGLSRLRVNEIEAVRIARDKSDSSSYVANFVPVAASLLDGFRFWHMG